ncbi:MAG: hypothetical protein KAQ84_05835, partial [Thermoplasmatales archaeon]|nr:hypothetical protein [Thermoplasmatales archaeon]
MHKIDIKKEKKEKKDKTAVFKKPIGLFQSKFNKRIFVLGIIIAFLLIAGGAISTSVTNEMNINKKTNPGTNLDLYNEIENGGTTDRGITWDVTLNFNEPGGVNDYVIFGEADDANDGPPHDDYDMPRPPLPQPPYIRAWFNDNLPTPYGEPFEDYRLYPDTYKVWNLTVQWMPKSPYPSTDITISWNINHVNASEYDSVVLYDVGSSLTVADMLVDSNY